MSDPLVSTSIVVWVGNDVDPLLAEAWIAAQVQPRNVSRVDRYTWAFQRCHDATMFKLTFG